MISQVKYLVSFGSTITLGFLSFLRVLIVSIDPEILGRLIFVRLSWYSRTILYVSIFNMLFISTYKIREDSRIFKLKRDREIYEFIYRSKKFNLIYSDFKFYSNLFQNL